MNTHGTPQRTQRCGIRQRTRNGQQGTERPSPLAKATDKATDALSAARQRTHPCPPKGARCPLALGLLDNGARS